MQLTCWLLKGGSSVPKVSVIIPCYNGARWLSEAIESVLAQTYTDYEIIVVDDGSTDNSADVVRSYPDNRLRYYYQENRGLPAALNSGIELSRGNYIAFIDVDDLWLPDKLEKQLRVMENLPHGGLVYSSCYVIDEIGNVIGLHRAPLLRRDMVAKKLFIEGNFILKPTVLVDVRWLRKVGLFDEEMLYCEDHDMWIRLAMSSCEILCIDEPLAMWRGSGSGKSAQIADAEYGLRLTEKLCLLFPSLKPFAHKRQARVYTELGRRHLRRQDYAQGRAALKLAIRCDPTQLRIYAYLGETFIPSKMDVWLRSLKLRLQRAVDGYRARRFLLGR